MLDWLKNKKYPLFWKEYLNTFEKDDTTLSEKRYVVFDLETSGLDIDNDVILSIGAIGVLGSTIIIKDYFEANIKQEKFEIKSVVSNSSAKEDLKISEQEAITLFLNYIKDAILVGHHINSEIAMLDKILERLGAGKLKNETFDTDSMYHKWQNIVYNEGYSLDTLCDIFKIPKSERHTATGDAYIIALLFLKLKTKLGLK